MRSRMKTHPTLLDQSLDRLFLDGTSLSNLQWNLNQKAYSPMHLKYR